MHALDAMEAANKVCCASARLGVGLPLFVTRASCLTRPVAVVWAAGDAPRGAHPPDLSRGTASRLDQLGARTWSCTQAGTMHLPCTRETPGLIDPVATNDAIND